jgi:hypothetical protein
LWRCASFPFSMLDLATLAASFASVVLLKAAQIREPDEC